MENETTKVCGVHLYCLKSLPAEQKDYGPLLTSLFSSSTVFPQSAFERLSITTTSSSSSQAAKKRDHTEQKSQRIVTLRSREEAEALTLQDGSSNLAFCDACHKVDDNRAFLLCSQCRSTKYCNQSCQMAYWTIGGHKKVCKQIARDNVLAAENAKKAAGATPGPRARPDVYRDEWSWRSPPEAVLLRKRFTLDQVTVAMDHDLDPHYEGMDHVAVLWDDLSFVVKEGTEPLFTGSIIPPTVKRILQGGLRDRRISWEYLTAGCGPYIQLLAHDAVRNSDKELVSEWIIRADNKPDAGLVLEQLTECFWRTVTSPGTPDYSQEHVDILSQNKYVIDDLRCRANARQHSLILLLYPLLSLATACATMTSC